MIEWVAWLSWVFAGASVVCAIWSVSRLLKSRKIEKIADGEK